MPLIVPVVLYKPDNEGWPWAALADVVDLRLSSVDKKTVDGERSVRLCNYSDVYHHNVIRADMDYMEATATEREIQNCRLKVGDVIITKDSETPDDIGVPAVVGDEVPNLVCGYHLAILRPLKANLDGRFLHYALSEENAKRQFQMYANGITRFGLRADDISRVRIPLPPVPEQRKIAAILSSVDDAIEKTQAVIDQAQIVKRGLMQVLLKREPDTWRSSTLGRLAQINPEQLGSRTDPDYLMEYLDISAIEQPGVIGDTRTFRFRDAPSRARRVVREGDILVSTVRPYLRNFARVREAPDNLVVSTGYAVVRPGDRVDGRFLYQHILSSGFVEYLKPRMSGSNYPAVTAHDVRAYPLSLPRLPGQRKIAAILSSVDDAIEKTRAIIDQARIVKPVLMSLLLSGELRVTPDTDAA